MSSRKQKIVFTGGSGLAGRHAISKLQEHGHKILNVDVTPLDNPDVYTLKADITDGAQAFNSLSCHFSKQEPFHEPLQTPDAVIHFAGIPQPMLLPDNELFRINTMGSYNIIESACKLGIKKIILASSITTYGVSYAEGDVDYAYFPVDEDCPCTPMDSYATSKLCMERVAQSFALRYGVDIYCYRIGAVIPPAAFQEKFRAYTEEPARWKPHAWSYTDALDLGNMCEAGLQKDGLGFQVFNAVNDEITNDAGGEVAGQGDAEAFLKSVCPGTKFVRSMGKREAPVSNRKMKEMLGFKEQYPWRERYRKELI
ncbi:NAD-dependent epimerase/dehydratase-like protein [Aaosphaeria arxii CBS 175.79]|uniref:NAD-dependent epimerase/dehydratase-like protein n=1 Tax=Aaosphaeria arxii CBS 175.79 TaxID=1450172 RepID=A0A6A5XRM2_9PLEO|nr:NAD-dependent epimerase/dehydratase-like protein [Aaosphaeria arxii CBS 175.79]KAF2015938.1 NAD-dependent epimerase/dehydratase-like protein [Aaosphaeria arxii CBS 175.79]